MNVRAMDKALIGRVTALLVALALLVLPHLLPAAPLDLLSGAPTMPDRTETANQNFPGSAFFFAEGAFDPVPGAQTAPHLLTLARQVTSAPALSFRGATALDSYRAMNCLTSAIYYEAANEPDEGQRAVAQVVLNRVRSPLWPNTVCGVVYEGSERTDMLCQFTFSCDGAMARAPQAAQWARARRVAQDALAGAVYAPVGMATHYHTLAVRPDWSGSLTPVAVVGAHIFYRLPGPRGLPTAFSIRYAGREWISGPARRDWSARPIAAAPREIMGPSYAIPAAPILGAPAPAGKAQENLPESTIRPEWRNTGKPIL